MFRVKYSRETALKLLYQLDILALYEKSASEILEYNKNFFKNLNETEQEFVIKIIEIIRDNKDEIDTLIAENLIGWKLERLMPVDRSLLRMGIAEARFNDQKAVIIDDIVRIAKKYGSEESYKIINAILDKVIS